MVEQLIERENKFNILKNAAGELMILIRARMDNAAKPELLYDGGKYAMLYRTTGNTIVLDFIHPEVRDILTKTDSILVVEAQGQSIVREYFSKVKVMEKIPLPENML